MRKSIGYCLSLALIVLLLALVASCESSNVGGGLNFAPTVHRATYNPVTRLLTVIVSDRDGDELTVSVTIPATLAVDHAQQAVAGGSGTAHFTWSAVDPAAGAAGASGTVIVSVTDNKISTPVTRDVAITVAPGNVPPVITSATFIGATSTLTVVVSDANGDDLAISIELPLGFIADASSKVVTGGSGTVTFTLAGTGNAGDATIAVSDGIAPPVTATCTVFFFGPGPPVIVSAVWHDNGDGSGTLTVDATSFHLWNLSLSVTTPAGASVDAAQQLFSGVDDAHAVFTFTETTPGAGANGEVVVTADNHLDPPVTRKAQITISPQMFQPWPLDPDTLYARPQKTTAVVGEAVTVYVYTGQPAHPLQFLSSVGFTVETTGTYVAGSFNIGAAGGGRTTTDGYWALLTNPVITDDNYLDLPSKIPGAPTDIGGGFQRYSFGVVPMGSSDAPAAVGTGTGPILFNFQLTFSAAGTYHLGFQLNDGAFDQTYYSDAGGTNYFWSMLDNSNTITVQ